MESTTEPKKITVRSFETKVWKTDKVRIVIRYSADAKVPDYGYTKAVKEDWTLKYFLETRIKPLLGENEVAIVNGVGKLPPKHTALKNLRNTYKEANK